MSLADVAEVYRELQDINRKFGEDIVKTVPRLEDETDDQWLERTEVLLDQAFKLTVTVKGGKDEEIYDESVDVFASEHLPKPIQSVFFTNRTAWSRNANGAEPPNQFELELDFRKPALVDPSTNVSDPTPNNSAARIRANDIMYFRAVQSVIKAKVLGKRTWFGAIHRSFAYDAGVWLLALPISLILSTHFMRVFFPVSGPLADFRWAFFIYALGISLIIYRFISAYIKWAFPVNVLADNKDAAWRHRIVLGGVFSGLAWKVFDVVQGLF